MLLISLREGDYVMIGENVRVSYDHLKGRDHLVLAIEAPKDVNIARGKVYEQAIAEKAQEGCGEALELSRALKKEYADRARKAGIRRSRREEQERRVAAGEIRPYHQNSAGRQPERTEAPVRKVAGSRLS